MRVSADRRSVFPLIGTTKLILLQSSTKARKWSSPAFAGLEWTRNVDMDELAGVCSTGTGPRLRLFRRLCLCAGRATFGRSHNVSHLEARLGRGVLKFLASNVAQCSMKRLCTGCRKRATMCLIAAWR